MRNHILSPLLIAGLSCVLLWHAERGTGQTVPAKKTGSKIDPGVVFDAMMAKGRGYFLINEVSRDRAELEKFAAQEGIKNGKVTRTQFIKYWNQRAEQRAQAERQKEELARREAELVEAAARAFNDIDLNRDGFLNSTEINLAKPFKTDWRKWDTDGDGLINLAEWNVYWRHQQQEKSAPLVKKPTPDPNENPPPLEPKKNPKPPVVVKVETNPPSPPPVKRIEKMPPTLPAWFKQIDLDGDGQISLFEWEKAGKNIDEFIKLDTNDDGFLTAQEVLRSQQVYILPRVEKEKKKDNSRKYD